VAQTGIYHGGIVFLGNETAELDRFCRIVSATLEDYGHAVERQSVIDAHQARVVTSRYLVDLSLDDRRYRSQSPELATTGGRIRHRLEIGLTPVSGAHEERDISELMMVVMLYRMVDICNTEAIEWMDPGTVLTVDQFLGAFGNVSPQRMGSHGKAPDRRSARFVAVGQSEPELAAHCATLSAATGEDDLVALTPEEELALAFRAGGGAGDEDALTKEEKAQNDIRRLATWGLTGMVAFLSTPVAAAMAAVNLARGEDFRLNTQVLSLTGFIAIMHGSGTLAQAASYLPI
jgi:hypothetical protein